MKIKQNLYIIGAGGFGREVESWLNLVPVNEQYWKVIGFLDDDSQVLNGYPSAYKVVGKIYDFKFQKDDLVIMAIAETSIKEKVYEVLFPKVKFMTFIAPSAIIAKYSEIGEGSVVCPNSIVATNTKLGVLTTINNGTHIGHDSNVGNFCSFMANVDISGNCKVGNNVFVGSNATIIPGKSLDDNVFIGAGSIVVRNVKRGSVFGNPAKQIK